MQKKNIACFFLRLCKPESHVSVNVYTLVCVKKLSLIMICAEMLTVENSEAWLQHHWAVILQSRNTSFFFSLPFMPHDRFLGEFEPVKNSPQFDNVVTAENCYYYLSLLESFYEVEQSMSPELFKRYVVAAEKRYLEFMQNYNTFGLYDPLPLDIAYAWHAHMLSPFRYYDDLNSNYNYGSIKLSIGRQFPLKAMHLQRRRKSLGVKDNDKERCRRLGIYPWDLDVNELRHATFEDEAKRFNPYYLPSGENVPAYIQRRFGMYIPCASCGTELFFGSWEQYEQFRMDPNIAFQCPAPVCKGDTTVDTAAVSELLSSIPHKIKGTRLKSDGTWKEVNKNEEAIRERLGYLIQSRKNSIRCIKDVCDLLTNPNLKFDVPGKPPLSVDDIRIYSAYAKEFAGIIRSTYENNPTRLSLDLVQAMHRQREFIQTMVTKIAPKWSNPLELEIPNAIRDYHDFLLLIKSQSTSATILPTWSVDMVWHVHMLHFSKFRELTIRDLGRMLNHDNNIVPFQLNEHYLATEKAWSNVPSSIVSLNLGRITKQGIHEMRPSLVNSAHIYKELQSTMINYYTRRKLKKNGVSFTKFKLSWN
ncbi:hypothetical protein BJV82DRAFT_168881 [Fennellomyces sp. T-0311]|nr:hypothetical protein BJV82DRAFT_168881 [Fennellomyces sp. T-0311]